jgi:3-oxoadipate enol-lactonase
MGGNIAQWMTVKHPQVVSGLVLSNSTSGANWTQAEAEATYQRFLTMAENMEKLGMREYVTQRVSANFSPGFAAANKELVQRYVAAQSESHARSCARTMRMLARRTLPEPHQIQCPTLVITGEHDALAGPTVARTLHEGITGSQLKVLPTGHASPFEAWESWNKAVLEFLDGIP